MAQTLRIDNFNPSNIREKTFLSADAAASATSLTVKSTNNIEANLFALVGAVAQEATELRRISTVTAPKTLALAAALSRAHPKHSSVTVLNADQLRVYRAESEDGARPADDTFALHETIDIDPDQLETVFIDATGTAEHWYKFTYFNSETDAETPIASAVAMRAGGSVRGASVRDYASLDDIRREAGFGNNDNVPYGEVDRHRRAAEDEINASLRSRYAVPFGVVPPLVTRICVLLAAGNMLSNEYERFEDYQTDRGSGKRKEARMYLEKLKTGEMDLFDEDGLEVNAEAQVRGWPDSTTAHTPTEEGGGEREFRVGMRF